MLLYRSMRKPIIVVIVDLPTRVVYCREYCPRNELFYYTQFVLTLLVKWTKLGYVIINRTFTIFFYEDIQLRLTLGY